MSAVSIEQVKTTIKTGGIVAIARGSFDAAKLCDMSEVLIKSGYTAFEVTMNSDNAEKLITKLRNQVGERMLIGAGTVLNEEDAGAALDAGAQYLISPGLDRLAVELAQDEEVLIIPGVFSPTEVQQAFSWGCGMLKLFPADNVGTAYLKALRAPFNQVEFLVTGGVSAENVAEWRRAGAAAAAAGGTLLSGEMSLEELERRAVALRSAWLEA